MPDIGPITAARAAIVPPFPSSSFSGLQSRFCSRVQTPTSSDPCPVRILSPFQCTDPACCLRDLDSRIDASLARMWFLTFRDRP